MSNDAPEWFKTQYNDRAIEIFQSKGFRLIPTVQPAMKIDGEKAIFMKAGTGEARLKTRGQRAVPMNPDRSRVEALLKTWQAFDTCEEYDLDRMGVNEREVLYNTGAMALGRAVDKQIVTAIDAAAATSGDRFVDGSTNAFSLAYAMAMCDALQDATEAWDGEYYCPLPSRLWNQFISYKQVSSSDYVGSDIPYVKRTATRFWNGVNWFLFPKRFFPSPAANTVDIFLWHRDAIGWGNHTQLRTIWQWDNYEDFWTINMESKGADVVLQDNGIVRGRFMTNTAITVN